MDAPCYDRPVNQCYTITDLFSRRPILLAGAFARLLPAGYRPYLPGMSAHVWLAIAIVAEVIATSTMRATQGFTRPGPSLVTVAGYAVAFYCLSLALRTMPTGIAYAIWSGVGIVLVAGIAWGWQGQRLDAPAMLGMALIIAGVIVMNLFSKSVAH